MTFNPSIEDIQLFVKIGLVCIAPYALLLIGAGILAILEMVKGIATDE